MKKKTLATQDSTQQGVGGEADRISISCALDGLVSKHDVR